MFDFNEYKRRIVSYSKLSNIKVLVNDAQHHEIIGKMRFCGYLISVSITCDCYNGCAYVRPIIIIGENKVNYIGDKEFYAIKNEINYGLSNCHHMQYNGIFCVGGVSSEKVEGVGLRFTDLNSTDSLRETFLGFKCIDTAINWLYNPNLSKPIEKLCIYFANKKALYAVNHL